MTVRTLSSIIIGLHVVAGVAAAQASPAIDLYRRVSGPLCARRAVTARVPSRGQAKVELMTVWSPGYYKVENYADLARDVYRPNRVGCAPRGASGRRRRTACAPGGAVGGVGHLFLVLRGIPGSGKGRRVRSGQHASMPRVSWNQGDTNLTNLTNGTVPPTASLAPVRFAFDSW